MIKNPAKKTPMWGRNKASSMLLLLVILGAACTTGNRAPTATSRPAPETSTTGIVYPVTQLALEAQATANARVTVEVRETEAKVTEIAEQIALRDTATSEAQASATALAQPMSHRIRELLTSGIISTSEGSYHPLQDFDASWAQINYYDFLLTGLAPVNFVLSAKVSWESASETANWWNSGCGFVFRMNSRGDHYLAYLGLDGWFYLYRNLDQTITLTGRGYYGEVMIPKGDAEIMLIVEGDWIVLYVNGEQVHRMQENTFSSGLLGYALISGTNKDFGTRCQMQDVELFELEPH
jgi:hypothetical protein